MTRCRLSGGDDDLRTKGGDLTGSILLLHAANAGFVFFSTVFFFFRFLSCG